MLFKLQDIMNYLDPWVEVIHYTHPLNPPLSQAKEGDDRAFPFYSVKRRGQGMSSGETVCLMIFYPDASIGEFSDYNILQ